MAKKPNLADFIGEYEAETKAPVAKTVKTPQIIKTTTPEFLNEEPPTVTKITKAQNTKTSAPLKLAKKPKKKKEEIGSEGPRITFILSEEMNDKILEAQFKRKRKKQPSQLSQIMREAVEMWLSANA